jgi:DNA repair ATPase RecN
MIMFEMHVHHHQPNDEFGKLVMRRLADIDEKLAALTRLFIKSEREIMVSVKDLQDQANATLQQVQAETDIVNAVKKVVDDQNTNIAALKQQVDDLIAAGGASAQDLQTLADTLTTIQQLETSNAAVVSAAVAAGTPVDTGGGGGGTDTGATQ